MLLERAHVTSNYGEKRRIFEHSLRILERTWNWVIQNLNACHHTRLRVALTLSDLLYFQFNDKNRGYDIASKAFIYGVAAQNQYREEAKFGYYFDASIEALSC